MKNKWIMNVFWYPCRAVYSRAKHIFIDDALSAVDTNTANYLINECISGPLMNKRTRILVTHHLNLTLPIANYMVSFPLYDVFLHWVLSVLYYNIFDTSFI